MCLYPKLIENRKYKPNKKNNYNPPKMEDERVGLVAVGCGYCIECKSQKSREWRVRLQEEIRHDNKGKFVTLTFSNESLEEIGKLVEEYAVGYTRENRIATIAVRRFLERWRKKHKKSVKHWFTTELGQGGSERIHIHGIMWTNEIQDIIDIWKYGHVYIGEYVNERTINYVVKYMLKVDEMHKLYQPIILTSAGIGKGYMNRIDADRNKYNNEDTNETYRTRSGIKLALPIYYRNKIYSEEEREKLWIHKLDKEEIYVMGEKIDLSDGDEEYYKMLAYYQEKNKRMGYGGDMVDEDKKNYNRMRRRLKYLKEQKKVSK